MPGVMQRNVEGLAWFLRECWPRIRHEVPRARLLVAGSLDPARLPRRLRHETGVTFTGRREDLQFAFDEADVSVVPVRIGGGTKLKAFESLSAGLPVVARPEAVDGECCDDLHGVLVRSDAMSYAAAVVSLLASPDARCELGRRARAAIMRARRRRCRTRPLPALRRGVP